MKNRVLYLFLCLCYMSFSQTVDIYKKHHDIGREFLLQGKYKEAIIQFDSSIAILPYGSEMYYERGYAKMQLGYYKEAILDFSMVINKTPHKYHAYISRGIARYHIDNFYGAKQDLETALKQDPENTIAKEYLQTVNMALQKISIQNNQQTHDSIQEEQNLMQKSRYERRRQREQLIWGTIVPITFWTSVFLTW